MPEFSTTTQALLDTVCSNTEPDCDTQHLIAAALEAVADQVVPENPGGYDCCITQCEQIRAELLAIAAELNRTNPIEPKN
jgi:hypothetical protein